MNYFSLHQACKTGCRLIISVCRRGLISLLVGFHEMYASQNMSLPASRMPFPNHGNAVSDFSHVRKETGKILQKKKVPL